jgi:hypothetical protein
MGIALILLGLSSCTPAHAQLPTAPVSLTVAVNTNGVLLAPTNFFTANSNVARAVVTNAFTWSTNSLVQDGATVGLRSTIYWTNTLEFNGTSNAVTRANEFRVEDVSAFRVANSTDTEVSAEVALTLQSGGDLSLVTTTNLYLSTPGSDGAVAATNSVLTLLDPTTGRAEWRPVEQVLLSSQTSGKIVSLGTTKRLESTGIDAAKLTNAFVRIYNVRDFGAVGDSVVNDSTWPPTTTWGTDDTPAITNALLACLTNGGGTVYFPPGVYRLTSPLTLTKAGQSRVQLRGAGANASRLAGDFASYLLTVNSSGTGDANKHQNVAVVDLGFANVNSATNSGLIRLVDCKWISLHRVVGWGGHVGLEISALSELSAVACNFNNQSWAGLHTRYAAGNPAPDLAASSFLECNFINSSTYAAVLDYFRHLQFYSGGISSQLDTVQAGVWVRGQDEYCNTLIFRDVSFETKPSSTIPALQIGRFDGGTVRQIDNLILDHCYLGTVSRWCRVGAVQLSEPVVMRECNFYGTIANAAPLFDLTSSALAATNRYSFRLRAENCFPAIELYIRDSRSTSVVDDKLTQFWPQLQNPSSDSGRFLGLDMIEGNDVLLADTTSTNLVSSVSSVSAQLQADGTTKYLTLPFARSGQYITLPVGTTIYAEAICKWSNAYPPQLFGWRRPDFESAIWGNAEGAYEVYQSQTLDNGFVRVFARTRVIEPGGYDGIVMINTGGNDSHAWLARLRWYAALPSSDGIPTIRATTRLTRGYVGPGQRLRLTEKDGVAMSQTGFELVTVGQGWLSTPWTASAAVTRGDLVTSSGNTYVATLTGTNHASTALSGTGSAITNGTAVYRYFLNTAQQALLKPVYPLISTVPTAPTSPGSYGLQALNTGGTWPMGYIHDGNNWFQHRLRLVDTTLTYPDYATTNVAPAAMTSPGRLGLIHLDTATSNKWFYIHDGSNWHRGTLTAF